MCSQKKAKEIIQQEKNPAETSTKIQYCWAGCKPVNVFTEENTGTRLLKWAAVNALSYLRRPQDDTLTGLRNSGTPINMCWSALKYQSGTTGGRSLADPQRRAADQQRLHDNQHRRRQENDRGEPAKVQAAPLEAQEVLLELQAYEHFKQQEEVFIAKLAAYKDQVYRRNNQLRTMHSKRKRT